MPVLTGEVCRLRPLQKADAATSLAWRQDSETRELVMGYRLPVTESGEAAWYERVMNDRNRATFAIEDLRDSKLVGLVHLMDIDWVGRSANFGIVIGDKTKRRHGFGRDATLQVLRYGVRELNLHRIELRVIATHSAALRLYESAGFVREGLLREAYFSDGKFCDVAVMGLLAADFKG